MKSRLIWVAATVVCLVIVAGYSAGWFYLAGMLESRTKTVLSDLRAQGMDVACEGLSVGGYPFEIALSCAGVNAKDAGTAASVETGTMRSSVHITNPAHVVTDLDAPVTLRLPGKASVEAEWRSMRVETGFWSDGLESAALSGSNLHATARQSAQKPAIAVDAGSVEGRTRRVGDDLEADFSVSALRLEGIWPKQPFPPVEGAGTVRLDGMAAQLGGRGTFSPAMLRGASGTLRGLSASIAKSATISLSGPFSFDDQGRLSGKFALAVTSLQTWRTALDESLLQARDTVASAASMLGALSGDDGTVSLTLTADHGRLTLGLIPVAVIPPV